MGKVVLSINLSVDGYADHTVAVGADDELHDFYTDLLGFTEIALLGRVTYELMAAYWPHAHEDPETTPAMRRFADAYNAIPKVVFSRTLEKAEWSNTRIVRNNPRDEIRKLKRKCSGYISVGGIQIAQELMQDRLVDEYWLAVQPIVVGHGRRLFATEMPGQHLKLADTRAFASGVVVLHYRSAPDSGTT
jgi:dihydrofolate reductase